MTYKIKSRNQSKKPGWRIFIPALLALIVVIGVVSALTYRHFHDAPKATPSSGSRPVNSVDYSPAKPAENTSNENRKSSSSPSATLDNGSTSANDSSSSSTPATFSVKIVSHNPNGNTVHVGTLVSGTTSGNCTLTATQTGQQSVTDTSTVEQDVNNYDCGAFNIQLPSGATGTWNLTLTVNNNGSQASDAATVTL